jgi:hypothetical protein
MKKDKIIRHTNEILEFRTEKDKFSIIWVSDLHYDSKHSVWNKVKKYLNENPEYYIVIGGDSLDLMQFVKDLRGSKSAIKDEYNGDDYANRIIHEVRSEIVEPYKDRIISWNRGNHDNSIIRHHNIDILNLICGLDVHIHEFTGYIKISCVSKSKTTSKIMFFQHAPHSGGKRSFGALSVDIAKAEVPSADIWIAEHIHNGFIKPVRHEFVIVPNNAIKQKNKWYIQNISCKDEHAIGKRNGFHHEKIKRNAPVGVCKIDFEKNKNTTDLEIKRCNHIIF